MYDLLVFVHIAGALLFAAAHGVAGAVGLEMRREDHPARLAALLDLSAAARPAQYLGLALLLAGGLAAGWVADWWSTGWIWASLGLLVLLVVGALPLAVLFARLRRALRSDATSEVRLLRRSPVVLLVAGYEAAGILAIVWLMVAKPF
jgi:uncharacterized membrane protein